MARAADVLEARNGEGREREGLHVDVLDLVPELVVVHGEVPRDARTHAAPRAQLELPRRGRIEIVQVAGEVAGRGQLEEDGRLIGAAGIAVDLGGRGDLPDGAYLRRGPEEVDAVGVVAVGVSRRSRMAR